MIQERRMQKHMPYVLLFLTAAAIGLSLLSKQYSIQIRMHYLFPLVLVYVGFCLKDWHFENNKIYLVGVLFAGWYALTRVFNGDVFFTDGWSSVSTCMITYLFAFPFAFSADDGERRRGLDLAAGALIVTVLSGTVLAFVSITDGKLLRLDQFGSVFGMSDGRLWINYHPNSTAILLMIGICAMSYLMVRHRCVWVTVTGVVINLVFFFALMLTVSRTVMVEVSLLAGAACFFLILKGKKPESMVSKTVLAAAGFLAAVLITYSAFGLLSNVYNKINVPASAKADRTENLEITECIIPAAFAQEGVMERPISENIMDLTGRTDLWKSGLLMMKDNPKILVVGMAEKELMETWEPYKAAIGMTYFENVHLHNAFLQVLAITGIPGLLLALVLTFAALKCSWNILIRHRMQTMGDDKILCLLMLVLLVNCITEPFLFLEIFSPTNFVFFLCLGYCIEKEKQLPKQPHYVG